MKEIHFYKDGLIESCYGWYLTHNSTMSAIEANNPCIYTTAISALDFSYLLDKGYRIFLHENGRVGEICVGNTELTDRYIREVYDIKRIWIGGGFQEYFYNEQNNLNNGTEN